LELTNLASTLESTFAFLDKRWEGYDAERITHDDFAVTIAAIVDYLSGVEGTVSMEIPNTDLKVERDEEGRYRVWICVGELDVDSIPE